MKYKIKFLINGKGYIRRVGADNERMARQKFLHWLSQSIVSIEPDNNDTGIMDFLNGFRNNHI